VASFFWDTVYSMVAVWLSGNIVGPISEVTLRIKVTTVNIDSQSSCSCLCHLNNTQFPVHDISGTCGFHTAVTNYGTHGLLGLHAVSSSSVLHIVYFTCSFHHALGLLLSVDSITMPFPSSALSASLSLRGWGKRGFLHSYSLLQRRARRFSVSS